MPHYSCLPQKEDLTGLSKKNNIPINIGYEQQCISLAYIQYDLHQL